MDTDTIYEYRYLRSWRGVQALKYKLSNIDLLAVEQTFWHTGDTPLPVLRTVDYFVIVGRVDEAAFPNQMRIANTNKTIANNN